MTRNIWSGLAVASVTLVAVLLITSPIGFAQEDHATEVGVSRRAMRPVATWAYSLRKNRASSFS
jgi:hypothetical protein